MKRRRFFRITAGLLAAITVFAGSVLSSSSTGGTAAGARSGPGTGAPPGTGAFAEDRVSEHNWLQRPGGWICGTCGQWTTAIPTPLDE